MTIDEAVNKTVGEKGIKVDAGINTNDILLLGVIIFGAVTAGVVLANAILNLIFKQPKTT